MNTDEYTEFQNRYYVNPEVSMDEQNQFIDKFRDLQNADQVQINRDTYNLGTPTSSNKGGLVGAEGMWDVQYRRPAVNQAIENLRQVNMQQALNMSMANQQNVMANRVQQAQRNYNRAQAEAYKNDRLASRTNNTPSDTPGLGIDTNTGQTDPTDLAARPNAEKQQQYDEANGDQFNETMQNVTDAIQSGDGQASNSVGFAYTENGKPVYGTIYRDNFGKITGVSVPGAKYSADDGRNFLLGLANSSNLLDTTGKQMSASDVLLGL